MDSEDEILGDLTELSDYEECEEGDHTPSSPSMNMDFMTSLLQTSSEMGSQKKQRKLSLVEDKSDSSQDKESEMSIIMERMKKMEKELSLLRQKVKSSESSSQPLDGHVQSKITRTFSSNGAGLSSSTGMGISSRNSVKKEKRVALSKSHPQPKIGGSVEGDRGMAAKVVVQRKEDKAAGVVTEKYSGLRIKNPLISSDLMKERMKGRSVIKIKNVGSSVIDGNVPGDWVLIGVLVDKLPPRDDKKGKKYVIWKLSDLSSQTAVISLFLFGAAFQAHWKTSMGTVMAILNPEIVPNKETSMSATKKASVAVSIHNDKKMMLMGTSQDYTLCKGVTKAGKKCTNFASVSDGGYCDYHISKAFDKSRSNRMEFQSGYGPSVNRGRLKEKLFSKSKTEYYYYGGETFAAAATSREAGNDGSAGSSSRLFAPGARATAAKLVADLKDPPLQNSGPQLKSLAVPKGIQNVAATSDNLQGLLKSKSLGGRMLVESMKKKEDKLQEIKAPKPVAKTSFEMLQDYREGRPCLAKGCGPGGIVELSISPKTHSAMKRKASAILRLNQVDATELKRKRLMDRVQQSRASCEQKEEEEDGEEEKVKRARISLDMDKIMNAKSSHSWLSEEADLERESEYFDRLEKKENIEQKKERVTQLTVSAVHCKKCNYTAESPGELCSKEGHHLSRLKAIKKAFVCSNCNQKIFEYDVRWPVRPCSKCGSSKYNPASLYYIKKGPTLPTEELLLRGVEEKFLS